MVEPELVPQFRQYVKHITPLLKSADRDPFEETEFHQVPNTPMAPDNSCNNPAKMTDNFRKHKEEDQWT